MADEEIKVKATPINKVEIKGAIAFSAEHARIWAEGTDEEVEKLGGEHSAKGWAGEAIEEGKQYTDEQIAQARVDITEQINTNSLNVLQQAYGYTDNAISAEAAIREAQAENYVKKNESPTLDAGGSYAFNFETDSQNLRIMASDSGLEFEHRTAGSAIRMGSNGDISLEPSAGKIVFADGNPVITTKDKATTSALGVVKVDGETISANNGVISVTPEGWQKPTDWVDIRSGALPNSVYFLVGHSADYSTYPTFGLTATTSEGTYDVFVDGIKQATTASGTATELNWQTLALTSGWDVTTPSVLHTHIVRVTPTTSTATLTGIKTTLGANYGVLWAHFNVANPIDINSLFNTSGNNDGTKRCYVLQAVTSYNNEIQVADKIEGAFHYCYVLKEIPTLVYAGASTSTKSGYRCFRSCYALRKVRLVNFGVIDANSMFMNASAIREIDTQNSSAMLANYSFQNCQSLKKLPNLTWGERAYLAFTNMYALEPTVLHANSNNLLYIGFTGSSGNKVALKGLTVSNEAPFDGVSPQINVSYTGLDRAALVNLFKSMPYNVGYEVVGSPTIVDGLASGFSDSDYVQVGINGLTSWQGIELVIASPTYFSTQLSTSTIFGKKDNFYIYARNNGYVQSYMAGQTYGIAPVNTQVKKIKIGFTDTQTFMYYSVDGNTFILGNTVNSLPSFNTYAPFRFGTGSYSSAYDGSIDLNETYIKVKGMPWFRGTAAMTKTCDVRGCTGTADLTQTDKDIALDKGWSLTVA